WLHLKDASAARAIATTIAAGIITLTVFSFSMVMIVLNQAASQLSNRVLEQLIENRFQQLVLGTYIGTIVYALFILTTIREGDKGSSIPALSVYLLILIGILDIFLFIYFLHFITQAVRYEVIISKAHAETQRSLEKMCVLEKEPTPAQMNSLSFDIRARHDGVYDGIDLRGMLRSCMEYQCVVGISVLSGAFILKGTPLLHVDRSLPEEAQNKLLDNVLLPRIGSVEDDPALGFRQLTEIGMKALSPGINDPGTASLTLRALFQLFNFRMTHFPETMYRDKEGHLRIMMAHWSFGQIFEGTVLAIWDYGKKDRSILHELKNLLGQLRTDANEVVDMRRRVQAALQEHESE
ncbi:MAG: DUF2254 family protein, partial [Flavobacteriales bacterium]